MKGFIYLLEIAIAAILMVVVLSVFFAIRVKQSWGVSDLVATGNNMLNYVSQNKSFFINILSENLTDIEKVKPTNINYGLNVRGSPKSNITVGCVDDCNYIDNLLTDVYVNGRWIGFDVELFDISGYIPDYDAIVLVNFTDYAGQKNKINEYLDKGGVVIGINATFNTNDPDFNEIFGLEPSGGLGPKKYFFEPYNPLRDEIEKYFLGLGFDASTSWYVWEEEWNIDYIEPMINISKPDKSDFRYVGEGDIFNLPHPVYGDEIYLFKVKKIWWSERVDFQVLNTTFLFRDFSELNDVIGSTGSTVILTNMPPAQAPDRSVMVANNTAIWISDFLWSDEYRTLVRAAIVSRNDEWTPKGVYTTKETTTVSSFFSLCCDMPETTELEITLWYIV